jgi:hypothetical protein
MKLTRITKLDFKEGSLLSDQPTINAALSVIQKADAVPYSEDETQDKTKYSREVMIKVNFHESVEACIDQFTPNRSANNGWTEKVDIKY